MATHMRWHAERRVNDSILRHPTYSKAWKRLDEVHPNFKAETRNVRLGLASDRFNPFCNSNHCTLPVILVPYNLPQWMCMNKISS